jgi:hypothetical protein
MCPAAYSRSGRTSRLNLVAIAEIVVRKHMHFGEVMLGDLAHRRPQSGHAVAGEPVEDPCSLAARADEPYSRELLQVMRGVGDALIDLARQLIDRALALCEHVHNLGAATVTNRLGNRGERVEERGLGGT